MLIAVALQLFTNCTRSLYYLTDQCELADLHTLLMCLCSYWVARWTKDWASWAEWCKLHTQNWFR